MKNFQYPLIASGAALMLLAIQPSQAANSLAQETDFDLNLAAVGTINPSIESTNFLSAIESQPQSIPKFSSAASLLAQTPSLPSAPPNSPAPLVPQPEIIIKSNDNGTVTPEILQPTTPSAPPLPRAVAPPVGDMAVSNIDAAASIIDLGTSAIVPRLVLRQAPAREVLAVLARYAGLNLVFTDTPGAAPAGGDPAQAAAPAAEPTVSLDLQNEPVQDVFNSVLMISGLKANRRGRTIFVGAQLPQGARNLISRTIRLNQVKSFNAGTFLAAQGAEFQRLVEKTEDITDPLTGRVIGRRTIPSQLEPIKATQAGPGTALLLNGLSVSADDRLNSITLIGEPRQVQLATSLLTQLDSRRRQVAVNVKVVDINLINTQDFNSSFSFGVGDSFFVQDQGSAVLRFGTNPAPTSALSTPSGQITNPPVSNIPLLPSIRDAFFQYPQKFLALVNAQIKSGNAKILTDPTLIVQESQKATVKLIQQVLTSLTTSVDPLSGQRTNTPIYGDAGLTLTVDIDKIDDNGFISLSVSPTIASPGSPFRFNTGVPGADVTLTPLNKRELSSGVVRLRDGQTLILSGIISQTDQTTTTKVPILGDIPILGALFRSESNTTNRQEVIILLTPQIINDDPQAQFGFNYNPGRDAAQILQNQGFPVQSQP